MITTSKLFSDFPVNLPILVVCAECNVWCGCSAPSSGVESWLVFRFVYQVQLMVILSVFYFYLSLVYVVISPAL